MKVRLVVAGTAALAAISLPAIAAPLVATRDVAVCLRLVDLDELDSRLKAQDGPGAALYLEGPQPACMVLTKGDVVEPLDEAGNRLQVVTEHGSPRFIGWGDRSSFGQRP